MIRTPTRKGLRRLIWLGAAVTALVVVEVALLGASVLWPTASTPDHADVVVSLSGGADRLPTARRLVEAGVAPVLVVAGTPDSGEHIEICKGGQPFQVICLQPEPDSTRAEARSFGRLAMDRGWRTVVVVTSKWHVSRATLLFDRCVDGKVRAAAAPSGLDSSQDRRAKLHEWVGLVHATFWARGC